MQEIEGKILIKYEPCFEDLIAVLLNNDYELRICKKNDKELEIEYIKRWVSI